MQPKLEFAASGLQNRTTDHGSIVALIVYFPVIY